LTVRDVVQAATAIAGEGVDAVTMSAVARRLGVTPMALYQHVRDKEHLLTLMMDSLLERIEVPPRSAGSWDVRLRRFHLEVTAAMAACPGLASSRGRPTAREVPRLLEGYLQILLDAGFSPSDAARAYTGLYFLAMGADHRHAGYASPAMAPPAHEGLPATEAISAASAGVTRAQWQEAALDIYLDGLRAQRRRVARARRGDGGA